MENMDVIMDRVMQTENLTGPANQFFLIMLGIVLASLFLYAILMSVHQNGKNAYNREQMIKINVKVGIGTIMFLILIAYTGNKMKKDAIDDRYDLEFQRRAVREQEESMGDYMYEYPSMDPDHYGLYRWPDGSHRSTQYRGN